MTQMITSTKDIVVNINGIEYECMLIPRKQIVDIDFSACPENHPKIRRLIDKVRNGEEI